MATFTPPLPLERRITLAWAHLQAARYDGNPQAISVCARRMDMLLERIPARPLALIDPELDQRLTAD